jgi:ABC-2 type transport system permease protein
MRFLDLALKDLTQMLREKRSLLFLLVMPIVFTFFMGFAFRGVPKAGDARLPLGWLDHDSNGLASKTLRETLSSSDTVRLVEIRPADTGPDESAYLAEQVRKGTFAGVLVIPEDFSDHILTGKPVRLTLTADDLTSNGQAALQAVRGALTRLMSSVEIATLIDEGIGTANLEQRTSAFRDAAAAWEKTSENGLSVSLEKVQGTAAKADFTGGNPYNQTSPGILVQFAIFSLTTSAGILVQERKNGTLQRLVTTSMTRGEIIAGHMLAMFGVVFVQAALLVVFGQVLLKVDYFREPAAVLLTITMLCVWVAAMGLLVGVISRGEEQVILFSMIAMFVFSALGGTWFPLETAGTAFAVVGRLMPSHWAMAGLQNILVRGQDFNSALLPSAVLGLFAVVFFGVALWRFRMD